MILFAGPPATRGEVSAQAVCRQAGVCLTASMDFVSSQKEANEVSGSAFIEEGSQRNRLRLVFSRSRTEKTAVTFCAPDFADAQARAFLPEARPEPRS